MISGIWKVVTSILLFGVALAGCGGSGSPPGGLPGNPSGIGSGSTPPTNPDQGFGRTVTLTTADGFVYEVQARLGPASAAVNYQGSIENAPSGTVYGVVYVRYGDGLQDRPEPFDPMSELILAVPSDSRASFGYGNAKLLGKSASPCDYEPGLDTAWCAVGTQILRMNGTDPYNPELRPGRPVNIVLATLYPIPQAASTAKIALFGIVPGRVPVQIPILTSG